LYYAYALEKCMERNVLSPKISLCSFAFDYLNSDSTKRQIHGIRTAHNPSTEGSNQDTAPCEAQCIDRGDDHTNEDVAFDRPSERNYRSFAAKVIHELAKSLLVVNSPGIVQNVSLLFDWAANIKE
jgi:hypothetical protein